MIHKKHFMCRNRPNILKFALCKFSVFMDPVGERFTDTNTQYNLTCSGYMLQSKWRLKTVYHMGSPCPE